MTHFLDFLYQNLQFFTSTHLFFCVFIFVLLPKNLFLIIIVIFKSVDLDFNEIFIDFRIVMLLKSTLVLDYLFFECEFSCLIWQFALCSKVSPPIIGDSNLIICHLLIFRIWAQFWVFLAHNQELYSHFQQQDSCSANLAAYW